MGQPTYYDVLGVVETATRREILRARNRLLHEHHPDKVPEHPPELRREAKMRAALIIKAASVLTNPAARARYDALLRAARAEDEGPATDPGRSTPKPASAASPPRASRPASAGSGAAGGARSSSAPPRRTPPSPGSRAWVPVVAILMAVAVLVVGRGSDWIFEPAAPVARRPMHPSAPVRQEDHALAASMVSANDRISPELVRRIAADDRTMAQCVANHGAEEICGALIADALDLNGDGVGELIVSVRSTLDGCELCGNRRCSQWLYEEWGGRHRLLLNLEGADLVMPLRSATRGYRDLGVSYPVGDEAVTAFARFDGNRYVQGR